MAIYCVAKTNLKNRDQNFFNEKFSKISNFYIESLLSYCMTHNLVQVMLIGIFKAATGGIIDPRTTQRHSAIDAFEIGLLLEYQIDTIRRAERACRGFVTVTENEKLSLFTAMQRGLVVESRGLR